MYFVVMPNRSHSEHLGMYCIVMPSLFVNCPAVICLPNIASYLRETPLVICGPPVLSFTYCLQTPATILCYCFLATTRSTADLVSNFLSNGHVWQRSWQLWRTSTGWRPCSRQLRLGDKPVIKKIGCYDPSWHYAATKPDAARLPEVLSSLLQQRT